MALITYVRPMFDTRHLSKADLTKYVDGYEGKALEFKNGEPTEVDDAVAEVLLKHDDFKDEFAEVKPEKGEDEDEAAEEESDKAAKKSSKKGKSKNEGEDVPAASGGTSSASSTSTGKGSSTAGSPA